MKEILPGTPVNVRVEMIETEQREATEAARKERERATASRAAAARKARDNGDPVRTESPAEEMARADAYQAEVPPATQGNRYDEIPSLIAKLAGIGFSESAIWPAAVTYGERCSPPFLEPEMRKVTLHKFAASIAAFVPLQIVGGGVRPSEAPPSAVRSDRGRPTRTGLHNGATTATRCACLLSSQTASATVYTVSGGWNTRAAYGTPLRTRVPLS